MATYYLVNENGETVPKSLSESQITSEQVVSYYEHLFDCKVSYPKIYLDFGSAKGSATRSSLGYEIRVIGKFKDVQVVTRRLEIYLGAKNIDDLSQIITELRTIAQRLRWLATGKIPNK